MLSSEYYAKGRVVHWKYAIVMAAMVVFVGCSDSKEPKVYRLAKVDKTLSPKIQKPSLHSEFGGVPPPPKPSSPLTWETPADWQELPASGMRIASFEVKGSQGSLDISLIFLGGAAGGDLSNVNRWREQLGEGPWSLDQLEREVQKEPTSLGEAKVIHFTAGEGEGLLAAIIPYQKGTWFLKMVGPKALVEENQTKFHALLKSLKSAHE